MIMTSKRIAIVIASNNFRDEEYLVPKNIFTERGIETWTLSSSIVPSKGILGERIKPDRRVYDIDVSYFQALVFVGGFGAREYFRDAKVHEIIRGALHSGKVIGAICVAPSILARAGVLNGRVATVYPSEKECLLQSGALYSPDPVCRDGQIITASGPEYAYDFALQIVEAIKSVV